MRVFTTDEKSLLESINEGKGGNLYNLIKPWIKGVKFDVEVKNKKVEIFFDTQVLTDQAKSLTTRLEEIQTILILSVNLIKLFEDKGYLFSYRNTNQIPETYTFGQYVINSPSDAYTFPDIRISELIVKYATQEIFVTAELNKFIEDGFITREQVNANRQFRVTSNALKTTRIALYITTTGVLLTLGFNIYNSFFKRSDSSKNQPNYEVLKIPDTVSKKNNNKELSLTQDTIKKNDTTKHK